MKGRCVGNRAIPAGERIRDRVTLDVIGFDHARRAGFLRFLLGKVAATFGVAIDFRRLQSERLSNANVS